jgi:hypothetical protein
MANRTLRIATVKATGERYVVRAVDCSQGSTAADNVVHCFGHLASWNGTPSGLGRMRFLSGRSYKGDEVTIATVPRTLALARELLEAHVNAKRAQGANVWRTRGGNYRNEGTPLERGLALLARERALPGVADFAAGLQPIARAMGHELTVPEPTPPAVLQARLLQLAEEAERKGLPGQRDKLLEAAASVEAD